MSNRAGGPQEGLIAAFQSQMNNVYTALPCIVVAIRDNLNTQMVDIQPTINQKLKDGTIKERAVILGVPVVFPVSKTSGFTFPINVGDTGLAVFSMRNIDAWKSGNGGSASPMNFAKMDKSDAVFIPGLQPMSSAVNNPAKRLWPHDTKDAVVVHNIGGPSEVEIRMKPTGDLIINTQRDVDINCNNAVVTANTSVIVDTSHVDITAETMTVEVPETTWIGNITLMGNIIQTGSYTSTGTVTFNGIIFGTHDHIPGPGPSNP
jgi:hypothetical protein